MVLKVNPDMQNMSSVEMDKHLSFEQWFASPAGQSLLNCQRLALQARIARFCGARQLELAISHRHALAASDNFTQCMLAQVLQAADVPSGVCVCLPEELPFAPDSLDLVVLNHTLDLAAAPHQALREAARVLRGGGHLVIVGFNPVSLWGMLRWFHTRGKAPWSARFMSWFRVEDWLHLLDFEVESVESHFFRPPVQSRRLLGRLSFMDKLGGRRMFPLGCFYLVVAEKRVAARIPLRPVWPTKRVAGLSLVSRQAVD